MCFQRPHKSSCQRAIDQSRSLGGKEEDLECVHEEGERLAGKMKIGVAKKGLPTRSSIGNKDRGWSQE